MEACQPCRKRVLPDTRARQRRVAARGGGSRASILWHCLRLQLQSCYPSVCNHAPSVQRAREPTRHPAGCKGSSPPKRARLLNELAEGAVTPPPVQRCKTSEHKMAWGGVFQFAWKRQKCRPTAPVRPFYSLGQSGGHSVSLAGLPPAAETGHRRATPSPPGRPLGGGAAHFVPQVRVRLAQAARRPWLSLPSDSAQPAAISSRRAGPVLGGQCPTPPPSWSASPRRVSAAPAHAQWRRCRRSWCWLGPKPSPSSSRWRRRTS